MTHKFVHIFHKLRGVGAELEGDGWGDGWGEGY